MVDDRKVDHVHKFIDSNLDDDLEKDDDAAKVEDIVLEKLGCKQDPRRRWASSMARMEIGG